MRTHVRTHTRIAFANPFLRCAECNARADGFHDPDRCGCEGTFHLVPCGHVAEAVDICPSWGPVDGCRCSEPETTHSPRTLEVVRVVEALLDDADQIIDTPEKPNLVTVWGVRRALMLFGGRPHRWKVPAERCGECGHLAWNHDETCAECDCVLSRREAEWGRDEALDDEIARAIWEDAVTNGEPWTRGEAP